MSEIQYVNGYEGCVTEYKSARQARRVNMVRNTLSGDEQKWTKGLGSKVDSLFKSYARGESLQLLVNNISNQTGLGYATEFILQYFDDGNNLSTEVDNSGLRRSLLRIAALRDVSDLRGQLIDYRISKGSEEYYKNLTDIANLNVFEQMLGEEIGPNLGEGITGSTR